MCTSYFHKILLLILIIHKVCHSFKTLLVEIDRYGFFEVDADISKFFKSCILLHYQSYDVFYALPSFQNLENQDF